MSDFPTNLLPNFNFTGFNPVFIGSSTNVKAIWQDPENNVAVVWFHPNKKQEAAGHEGNIYKYENFDSLILGFIEAELDNDSPSVGGLLRREVFANPNKYPYEPLYVG